VIRTVNDPAWSGAKAGFWHRTSPPDIAGHTSEQGIGGGVEALLANLARFRRDGLHMRPNAQ